MNVTICNGSGFCFGVKRAIAMARDAAEKYGRCCTLGEIVHNPKVVNSLLSEGIECVHSIASVPDGHTVIIRSHGAAPSIYSSASQKGLIIVDATCPLVKKIHDIAVKITAKGLPLIVIGQKEHPEVQGICGYAPGSIVINSESDVDKIPWKKAGLVVQTTKIFDEFCSLSAKVKARLDECEIYNTICFETLKRQKNVAALAKESDVMIIAGGKNSSNTAKLFDISSGFCRSYKIDDISEISLSWFEGAQNIGLACGASTPIDELYKIKAFIEGNDK